MQTFHDYDPVNPWPVEGETHVIEDGKIILDYAPKKGTVSIPGFIEVGSLPVAERRFYIRYDDENLYKAADQVVHFNDADNGTTVTVNYDGVSTLIRARHFNEIKDFMEIGCPELVARMMVAHEAAIMAALAEHCQHITDAIDQFVEPMEAIKNALVVSSGADMATNDELDTMLDEYPHLYTEDGIDGPDTPSSDLATDDDVNEMLDSIFPPK